MIAVRTRARRARRVLPPRLRASIVGRPAGPPGPAGAQSDARSAGSLALIHAWMSARIARGSWRGRQSVSE